VCVVSSFLACLLGLQGKGDGNGTELCYWVLVMACFFVSVFGFRVSVLLSLKGCRGFVLGGGGVVQWWKCNYGGT